MKVSFLVTYYNQREYVSDSLNSIATLELPFDYEIVVGDDGSSDDTLKEVEKFRTTFGNRLRIFVQERDNDTKYDPIVRVSDLRKRLVKEAQGDYFCVLDGDDCYCDKSFASEATQIMDDNSNIAVVMHRYKSVWTEREEVCGSLPVGMMDSSEYIKRWYVPAGACVHRNYFKELGIPVAIKESVYYDDNDIVIWQLTKGEAFVKDDVVYAYRQYENSIWTHLSRPEQGILNALGMDVEIYLAPSFKKELILRYSRDLLYNYFRRTNIYQYVEKELLDEYKGIIPDKMKGIGVWMLDNPISEYKERQIRDAIRIIEEEKNDLYREVRDNVRKSEGII